MDQADKLIREIFFKSGETKQSLESESVGIFDTRQVDKKHDWKTKIKMCKTYMFYQVLKSFIWKNTYANPQSMFDVSGENQEADNDSNKQKAALVDCFDKMKYSKTMDKVIDYVLVYGEMITMCSWRKVSEEYRKKIGADDILNPKALAALAKGHFHFIDTKDVFDNPYVYPVNPANLVFDPTQKDNWDECPKIYKSYKVPNDIINNKYYTVSKEVADEIRAMSKKPTDSDSQMDKDLENKTSNGNTIEVLEHWGNLTLKDGTVLKNWHVVVVARKYVVRFERNNRIVNPFNYGAFITDPETKRGISPLYCVLSLAHIQEDLMNRTCDMQTLQENPPIYAPKGFFKSEEIELYPGKIIEFGDNLSPETIKQMEFSVSIFLNDITYLSDMMAEVSGIFPNMAGADEVKAKTATEISTKAQGQLTRLSMFIDTINQDIIVEDVKKVAKLRSDFKSGDEEIFVNKGNEKELITINDEIRQANYKYTYSDRTATTEKSNKADLVAQACQQFGQFIPLNVTELFTWYMEQKDVENPERFLQLQETIPQDVQNVLLQDSRVRNIVDLYNAQKEQGTQPPTQQATIPKTTALE